MSILDPDILNISYFGEEEHPGGKLCALECCDWKKKKKCCKKFKKGKRCKSCPKSN